VTRVYRLDSHLHITEHDHGTHERIDPCQVSDLVPSPYNVRRHWHASVEELAALIDSQRLLHSPTVHEHLIGRGKSRRIAFGVSAGERRRRALRLLQERGKLPGDHEVACKLIPGAGARGQLGREKRARADAPADEFEAFKALVDEGKGIEERQAGCTARAGCRWRCGRWRAE
jgi:ParB family chromosome partitioning protein